MEEWAMAYPWGAGCLVFIALLVLDNVAHNIVKAIIVMKDKD